MSKNKNASVWLAFFAAIGLASFLILQDPSQGHIIFGIGLVFLVPGLMYMVANAADQAD